MLIAYMFLVFGGTYIINPSSHSGLYLGYVVSLSVLLCILLDKRRKTCLALGQEGIGFLNRISSADVRQSMNSMNSAAPKAPVEAGIDIEGGSPLRSKV